ncbi:MAG: hypothetical protein RR052_01020 [Oscillospiraceae bacterium]
MENFIEKIISIDKKAKEIIDTANLQKEKIIRETSDEKEKAVEKQKHAFENKMAVLADEMQGKVKEETAKTKVEFDAKKKALENHFNENAVKWEKDITRKMLD